MELDKALNRISEIHAHMARGEVFRGYRAVPTAIISALAFVGAAVQDAAWPAADARRFVQVWIVVAGCSGIVAALDLWRQGRFASLRSLRSRTMPVLMQYLPAIVVGSLLAVVLAPTEHAALLPGLWALVHGMGLLASRPYLPRALGWAALWFLVAGAYLLLRAETGVSPSAWPMGITFGVGQALLALVLWANLERPTRAGGR